MSNSKLFVPLSRAQRRHGYLRVLTLSAMHFKHECCMYTSNLIYWGSQLSSRCPGRRYGTDLPSKLPFQYKSRFPRSYPLTQLSLALQQKSNLCIPLRGLCPSFPIHVSVSDTYNPRIGPHIFCGRKGKSIVGLYRSLTDKCVDIGTEAAQFLF